MYTCNYYVTKLNIMVRGVSSKEFKKSLRPYPPTNTVSKIQYFTHIIIAVIVMATIFTYYTLYLAGILYFDDTFIVISRIGPHRLIYIFLWHPRLTSIHIENR